MKAVERLVQGKEIDLEELEGRANQAQIQKVCAMILLTLLLVSFPFLCAASSD
jgi:hypothetical protein